MNTSFTATQIKRMRAEAKALSRTNGIGHQAGLNIVAGRHGLRNWDELRHSNASLRPVRLHSLSRPPFLQQLLQRCVCPSFLRQPHFNR